MGLTPSAFASTQNFVCPPSYRQIGHATSTVEGWGYFLGGLIRRRRLAWKAIKGGYRWRVLVVDDYEQFHQFVRSELNERPEFQIVGEAFDGLDAVHKAEDLQPDLILLDIGLPGLNGIDAARRIRTLCPESKILFLSQESSIDVVAAALSLGARGYLIKADAGDDLLEAIGAVIHGKGFVSPGLLSSGEASA